MPLSQPLVASQKPYSVQDVASRGASQTQLHMFDQLSSALSGIAETFGPRKRITEQGIKDALRQVRRALLDADVNVDVADTLIDGVRKRSLGQEVTKGVTADQQFIKAMYDELLDIMGGDSATASVDAGPSVMPAATLASGTPEDPAVVLLAGLQGTNAKISVNVHILLWL